MPQKFLIVERDPLICQDLAEMLTQAHDDVGIITCHSLEEAESKLDGVERLRVAFLSSSIARISKTKLPMRVAEIGGRIIVINGTEAAEEKAATDWIFVPRPFTTAMIEAALREV